jgi:GNAT superfamily N-acetyltransferase
MSDTKSIILDYRRDRRVLEIPQYRREDLGTVVRYSPTRRDAEGIVCFTNVPAAELETEIARHVSHFAAMGVGFEWKVYDADRPETLRARLLEAGFEQGEPEMLMVYPVTEFRPTAGGTAEGVDVRRLDDIGMLPQIVELQELLYARSFDWLLDQLRGMWEHTAFFGAYSDRRLVGSGWIAYPTGSRFAELHGGAVLPAFRGRRIYSRLFELRMMDAFARGVPWVAVDAAPMSRPILEAKGFQPLDSTYPMRWSHRSSD